MAIPENRKIPASEQISGIEAIIDANVPLADSEQFGLIDLKTALLQPNKVRTGTVVTFVSPAEMGELTNPITDNFTVDLTGGFRNKVTVFSTRATVPTYISEAVAETNNARFQGDSYSTLTTDINELEFRYVPNSGTIQVLIVNRVWTVLSPELSWANMVYYLKFEQPIETPVQSTILDSSVNNLTVNLTNEVGDLSRVTGVNGFAYKRGVIDSETGTRFTIPYVATLGNITVSSGLSIGFWMKLSSETTAKGIRLISTNGAFDGTGFRIDTNSEGTQWQIWMAPTSTGDTAKRYLVSAPNSTIFDDLFHFYYFRYNHSTKTWEVWRDNVLLDSSVLENVDTSPIDIASTNDMTILHTSSGGTTICEIDSMIVTSRFVSEAEMTSHYTLPA